MHVVIVRSRKNLIAFAQRQSVVEKGETGRGVLGQRDVLRVATDVAGDGPAHLHRNIFGTRFKDRAINCDERICIYFFSVLLDRLAHRPGVRRQKEQGEMHVIGSQFKLLAHRFPIFEVGRRARLRILSPDNKWRKRSSSERQ